MRVPVIRVEDVVIVVDGHPRKRGLELGWSVPRVWDEEFSAELVHVSFGSGHDGPIVQGGAAAVLPVNGVHAGHAIRLEKGNRYGRLQVPSTQELKYE